MSTEDKKNRSILSKDISFGKKKNECPSKREMNFIHDNTKASNRKALIIFAVFVILMIPFTYFGVFGVMDQVSEAERNYNAVQSQISTYQDMTSDYSDVKSEYDEKVGSFMSDDEKACTDRMSIFTMIEEDIMPSAEVTSISANGTKVTVVLGTTDLNTVSSLITKLQADSRNAYVTVTTTNDANDANSVIATFVITIASSGGTQS